MTSEQARDKPRPGSRTRWWRALAFMCPSFAITAGLATALAQGVLASSIVMQDSTLEAKVDRGHAEGIGLVVLPNSVKHADGSLGEHWVGHAGIRQATLNGVCVTQQASLFGVPVTLRITLMGDVVVNDVVADLDAADGSVSVIGLVLFNENGADVQVPGSSLRLGGTSEQLGAEVEAADLSGITARVQSATISGASLQQLDLSLSAGVTEC